MSERLPIALSVPHAGTLAPDELAPYHKLAPEQIIADSDLQAAEIYWPLEDEVVAMVTTPVARAFVDVDRAVDDISRDGVIKTHTRWDEPIWRAPPPPGAFDAIIERVYRPYHACLRQLAGGGARVGVDAHTIAAFGSPHGSVRGARNPIARVCTGGGACPRPWAEALRVALEWELEEWVELDEAPRPGRTIDLHRDEMPWITLEMSRILTRRVRTKRVAVRNALRAWAEGLAARGWETWSTGRSCGVGLQSRVPSVVVDPPTRT